MTDTTTTRARTIEGALLVALLCVAAWLRLAVAHAWLFAAALSDSLATSLTTLTVASLLLARERPRAGFAAAGMMAAACTLTRPDGILLLPAFVPATFALTRPRERWTAAAVAAAAFLLVY